MSEAAPKEKLRKVRVTKESGLFWLAGKPKKGDEVEVEEAVALSLIVGKNAVAVGWNPKIEDDGK